MSALTDYQALVRAMGPGFHPDTPTDTYTDYPEGYDADRIALIIDDAEMAGLDIYGIAMDVLEQHFNFQHNDEGRRRFRTRDEALSDLRYACTSIAEDLDYRLRSCVDVPHPSLYNDDDRGIEPLNQDRMEALYWGPYDDVVEWHIIDWVGVPHDRIAITYIDGDGLNSTWRITVEGEDFILGISHEGDVTEKHTVDVEVAPS